MTDGMRWRGALYGLASSAREGRGGHMTMMMTGAVGEAPGGLAACRAFIFQREEHRRKVRGDVSREAAGIPEGAFGARRACA